MNYKEEITEAMTQLGTVPRTVFLGEGLVNAGRIYGTLDRVTTKKCIEFPITENLQVSAAMGLCLEGFFPIVVFQRMDFMLTAMDALINHLALLPRLSGDRITFPLIVRAIVGSGSMRFPVGIQHCKDTSWMLSPYFKVVKLERGMDIVGEYNRALQEKSPTILVERKLWY